MSFDFENSEWRDAYFAHLERTEEIMAGDPEYDPATAQRLASEHASKLSTPQPAEGE